jgi:PAS domain-containing protein
VGIFWEVHEGAGPVSHPASAPSRPSRSAHAVEVILLKRLADRLTMPTMVIDAEARLVFYNPAAEPLIGRPFADVGQVELADLYDTFQFCDEEGWAIKAEDHPLYIALNSQQPCYRSFQLRGLDGVKHHIEGTAFPLLGQCDRHLGAVGIFWEKSR